MKSLLFALACACPIAVGAAKWWCDANGDAGPVHGRYVEARSASVFAGPCHINGEMDLQGRAALMGWRLDGGEWNDQDMEGVTLAVAVGSDENLAAGGLRQAVVYVDENLDEERRAAAVAWLETRQAGALGEVRAVKSVALELVFDEDAYRLEIPGVASLSGEALADKSCCSMDAAVAYEPLAEVYPPVVGNSVVCRFKGDGDLAAWTYQEQNNTFVACFQDSVACCSIEESVPVCGEAAACGPEPATVSE